MTVRNRRTGLILAHRVVVARSFASRARGLLGRRALSRDEGLWIEPAPSIHTFFMRFSIDALFVDGERKVVRIVAGLAPWRVAFGGRGAVGVLELSPGAAARAKTERGDPLEWVVG